MDLVPDQSQFQVLPGRKRNRTALSVDPEDQESSYPLGEWMIPASDTHGHSARIIGRVNPTVKNLIAIVLQSRKFPWQTESDLIRWCLHYGLERIKSQMKDPDVTNTMSVLNAVTHVTRVQSEQLQFQRVLDEANGVIQGLAQRGALPPARKIIKSIEDQIELMDDEYWKKKYREELVEKFGYLLSAKKGGGQDNG